MIVDKAKLRAAAEAATPGPWVGSYRTDTRGTRIQAVLPTRRKLIGMVKSDKRDPNHANADQANTNFIAAANPAVVLALLNEIAALAAERDRLRQDRDGLLEAGAHLL